ncbi:hypothetical protein TNCV_540321 [Trichonephila clavipes]|nr:hypothetical protein TNCV_540321 [Trichonephila clavipes]
MKTRRDSPSGYGQNETQYWLPGIKASLCKTSVDCLPGNCSSRHSSKVMKLEEVDESLLAYVVICLMSNSNPV